MAGIQRSAGHEVTVTTVIGTHTDYGLVALFQRPGVKQAAGEPTHTVAASAARHSNGKAAITTAYHGSATHVYHTKHGHKSHFYQCEALRGRDTISWAKHSRFFLPRVSCPEEGCEEGPHGKTHSLKL
eukprot:5144560-Amphidinium_carterae.3